jgi:hypothetical protein
MVLTVHDMSHLVKKSKDVLPFQYGCTFAETWSAELAKDDNNRKLEDSVAPYSSP